MFNNGQVKQLAHKVPEMLAISSRKPEQTSVYHCERENDGANMVQL